MVYKAQSERVKRHKAAEEKAEKMSRAIAECRQRIAAGKKAKFGDVARAHGVSSSTLERRVNGKGRSIQEFNATKQLLTPTEEQTLVDFILQSAEQGFPLTNSDIEKFADAVLESRLGTNWKGVGESWVFAFLDRHHKVLQTHWSKPLDTQRAKSLNPAAVKSWFDIVEEYVVKLGILPENIYGMDESGFPTANTGKTRVVGARGTKTQHKQGGADRENVTAIVTICADGSTVKPMIIYKGQNFRQKWNDNNIAEA